MRDDDLRFVARWLPDAEVTDLLEVDDLGVIPDTGGAYLLGTSDTRLVYPWQTSPIYYVGYARDLRARLESHLNSILEGRRSERRTKRLPRYQYGIALGADCCWFSASRFSDRTPEQLEAEIINEFYWHAGSTPVANGTWPWEKIDQPVVAKPDD